MTDWGLNEKRVLQAKTYNTLCLFRVKIGGEMRGKYGDFLNTMGGPSEEDSNHSHKKKMICGRTIREVLTFSAKQSRRFWPFVVFRQQQERNLRREDSSESKDDGGKKQELAR